MLVKRCTRLLENSSGRLNLKIEIFCKVDCFNPPTSFRQLAFTLFLRIFLFSIFVCACISMEVQKIFRPPLASLPSFACPFQAPKMIATGVQVPREAFSLGVVATTINSSYLLLLFSFVRVSIRSSSTSLKVGKASLMKNERNLARMNHLKKGPRC